MKNEVDELKLVRELNNKELIQLEQSRHVLSLDSKQQEIEIA